MLLRQHASREGFVTCFFLPLQACERSISRHMTQCLSGMQLKSKQHSLHGYMRAHAALLLATPCSAMLSSCCYVFLTMQAVTIPATMDMATHTACSPLPFAHFCVVTTCTQARESKGVEQKGNLVSCTSCTTTLRIVGQNLSLQCHPSCHGGTLCTSRAFGRTAMMSTAQWH